MDVQINEGAGKRYSQFIQDLSQRQERWLVTGVAGFIGSHLLETLLKSGQAVIGLDNFSTGRPSNLDAVRLAVGDDIWESFKFVEGDIRDGELCKRLCKDVDIVLHQAALGSVPRSIENPLATHESNVNGFLNMLIGAHEAQVKRFVYASSSSVYGDNPLLPKVESEIGNPLSPYALSKSIDEQYARIFGRCYGLSSIGLRYFNVFGPRQDPCGAYAAVIPRWVSSFIQKEKVVIYGDGLTSRDFSYIENIVYANLLAALLPRDTYSGEAYNIAVGGRTTLLDLFTLIRKRLEFLSGETLQEEPIFLEERKGDVKHSLADITLARDNLGYEPLCDTANGIERTVDWFAHQAAS